MEERNLTDFEQGYRKAACIFRLTPQEVQGVGKGLPLLTVNLHRGFVKFQVEVAQVRRTMQL